jgi:hypothetical protein
MKGLECTTSLTGTVTKVAYQPGTYSRSTKYVGPPGSSSGNYRNYKIDGALFSLPVYASPNSISTSLATQRGLEALAKAIRQAQTSLAGGQQTGELAEAVRMIRSPLSSLRQSLFELKRIAKKRSLSFVSSKSQYDEMVRRNRRKARAFKRMLTDTYLEWTYGIQPLVASIDDIKEGIDRLSKRRTRKYVVVDGRSDIPSEHSLSKAIGNLSAVGTRLRINSAIVVYRASVDCGRLTDPIGVMKATGFHWSDFVPTVYQLFPYSFVLDYFSNTGEVIDAACLRKSDVRWSNRTIVREVVQRHTNIKSVYKVPNDWTETSSTLVPHQVTRVDRTFTRSAYTGSFVPPLRFELPFGGSRKWLNLSALVSARGLYSKP